MKIPVTRGFDKTDPIGFLTLQDDVEIPLGSVFALGYVIQEQSSDGKPTKIQVQEVGLIPDSNYSQYLNSEKERDLREALDSIASTQAVDPRDWSLYKRDAWVYTIINGWSDTVLLDIAHQHNWDTDTVERLKRYHATIKSIRENEL